MKNFLFLLCLLVFASKLDASKLASALIEVNKYWAYETQALTKITAEDCAYDSYEMIQLHLRLVYDELSHREVSHLPEAQKKRRKESLEHLKYYADRALFPENFTHRVRRPIFIDHRGVHCAVGYLISASGHSNLSQRISANMNTYYLKDMDEPALYDWIVQSGFTLDELAWIQPGYPFPVNWDSMKGGTNGPVMSLAADNMSGVYAVGIFDTAGGYRAPNAAHYFSGFAGFDWMSLNGTGTDGPVYDILVDSGNIYLAGSFGRVDTVYTGSSVVKWNGSTWESLGQFYIGGIQNYVNDLEVYRDTLYAGGFFRSDIGASEFFFGLAKWNGQAWVRAFSDTSMLGLIQGEVNALHVHKGRLIVAGDFVLSDSAQSQNIFAINGNTPEFFTEDIPLPVNDLATYKGELYAATKYLHTGTQDTAGLIRLRNNSWSALLHTFQYPNRAEIMVLQETPHGLVFGGEFNIVPGLDMSSNLAALVVPSGLPEYFRSLGMLDSSVTALDYSNDNLYLGGYFTTGFSSTMSQLGHVSRIRLTDYLDISDPDAPMLKIYPNPSSSYVMIETPDDAKIKLQLFDMAGKSHACPLENMNSGSTILSTKHLAPGTYLLQVNTANTSLTEPLVITH